ncbi:MAG: excinuclease ABC subunit UvrC, partial [Chlamydiales bacterium]
SEKEALLLENNLIKKHQPKYNALLKDDKSYFSLVINYKHKWPMIRVVRFKGKPPPGNLYFGPYTHGHAARQTLELLRTLFPLRQCSDRELVNRSRPCILWELKRCIAPCVSKCTKEAYDQQVKRVIQFLRGHDSEILKELKHEMEEAVRELEFERADRIYQTITHIEKTLEKQKVEKAGSQDLDVLGMFRQGSSVALTQLFFREGKLIGSHGHFFAHTAQTDEELLTSFLMQQYAEADALPDGIVLPVSLKEEDSLSSLLSRGKTSFVFPKKGSKKALVEMAKNNAEAKFKREKEAHTLKEQTLITMEERFGLVNYPERIECFDNSNISGSEPVSAMVVFSNGERDSKSYRKFKIRLADPSDDYGALKEVLTRRYSRAKSKDDLPDLIVIDGGKGHLNLALEVLSLLDVSTVDVIAVAKEKGRHDRGMTAEQIFVPGKEEPVSLKPNSEVLFLLQRIRDEAHRFAITYQRTRRGKKSLESALDTIPGIGPIKKKRLLTHFGSLKRLLQASPEEWKKVEGITKKDIENLQIWKKDKF